MNAITEPNPTELHATIKLGIDAHAKWFYFARQFDGATPPPVKKMTLDGLLRFVAKQQRLAREVFSRHDRRGGWKGFVFDWLVALPAEGPGVGGGSADKISTWNGRTCRKHGNS